MKFPEYYIDDLEIEDKIIFLKNVNSLLELPTGYIEFLWQVEEKEGNLLTLKNQNDETIKVQFNEIHLMICERKSRKIMFEFKN